LGEKDAIALTACGATVPVEHFRQRALDASNDVAKKVANHGAQYYQKGDYDHSHQNENESILN
jgi:hypothetical protein